jgi:hypothetical protein
MRAGGSANAVYLDRAMQHVRMQATNIPTDLPAHVAPLGER